ncbi:MAG: type II toxin-antitoxin system HicA family toxin [Proteobacteria bacterium]|nr:type II toxin-antitoxin system HicA family toxin [Pseudomonadota bacterium]
MNSKQAKTLQKLFDDPIRNNIDWTHIASLIRAVGGVIEQGNGSRVRILIGEQSLNIHTPHPQKELKPYQIRAIRNLLSEQGIEP